MALFIKHLSEILPASEMGVCSVRISRRSAAPDSLNLRFSSDSAVGRFSIGDVVELFDGGERRFYGSVAKLPKYCSGESKNSEMLVESPWADMEKIVYQQLWKSADTASGEVVLSPVMRSKVVLGQNSEGEKIGVGEQVSDILSYAVSSGAMFGLGNISVDAKMLLDEARDLSCAEALARVLKWAPNFVAYFDYSGSGLPLLNILSSPSDSANLDMDSGEISSVSVSSRPDLSLAGVSVKYERENTSGDFSWVSVEEDIYPADCNPSSKNVLVMSVDLDGLRATVQTYPIETESIQEQSADWWRKHLPALAGIDNLQIVSAARSEDSYPRELVSGTVSERTGYETAPCVVSASVSYVDSNGSEVVDDVAVRVVSTNAPSGTLFAWNTSQVCEEKPEGLAKAIYEASLGLRFEGSAKIIGAKAENFFCKKINILNGDAAWENMNAIAMSCEEDLSTNMLTLKFGPPTHLYPANIAELFRIGRERKASTSWWSRSTAKHAPQEVVMDGRVSGENTSSGSAKYVKFVVSDSDGGGRVELDARDLSGKIAKFRDITICKDGETSTVKVLMTD